MALKPLVFEILLALVDQPGHGWNLVREVQERRGGEPLLPGNFYRTLRRMLSDGLIEEAQRPAARVAPDRDSRGQLRGAAVAPSPAAEERRRYFQLTALGERLARAEARRLDALVRDPRTRRLLRAR